MMSANSYFRFVSTFTIVISLLVGIGALYLIERIVPAIDEVLDENAYSVSSVLKMQESILLSKETSNGFDNAEQFWQAFENAKNNVTIDGESEVISQIQELASRYWQGDRSTLTQLSHKLTHLSEMNLSTMNKKNRTAKTIGLAGAWALGFLVLFALILQLSLRKKMFDSLIHPASDLLSVISEYSAGNYQRRYSSSPNAAKEIRKTGEVLNKILDENLTMKIH